jgi:hypothetical protein
MAILLLMDRSRYHSDLRKNLAGCYKRGDVVQVFDDSKPCVIPPSEPFLILRVRGIDAKTLQPLMLSAMNTDVLSPSFGEPIRRREYSIDLTQLPQQARDGLARERYAELGWADLRLVATSKITGVAFGDTIR